MATQILQQETSWQSLNLREQALKTRPMKFHNGYGEAIITRSYSGKNYFVNCTLHGYADGPMVYDKLGDTALAKQICDFVWSSGFPIKTRFLPSAASPSMSMASRENAILFAEYVIKRWDEFLQSYPHDQEVREWERGMFTRGPKELPYWIPQSFRK